MTQSTIEVPLQAQLTGALLNNVGILAANDGGEGLYAGIAMLRRAIALNPLDLGSRLNLANFLLHLGEDEEAQALCTFVLKRNEKAHIAWQQLGIVATNSGRLEDAIACFKRVHEIDPQHGQHKFDLAAAYLRAGRWLEGWPLYESRGEILPRTGAPPPAPTWRGEKTGHLMIWPDQGYGDLIMLSRLVPWAKERAAKVTFVVQPHMLALCSGFSTVPGIEVQCAYDPKGALDHQICLSSLPLVYGLTPANIPPDPALLTCANTQGRLPGEGLRIGIAWQGNPQFPGDRMRSIALREFLPLAADPRNTIYSLQVGLPVGDIAKARAQRIVRDMSSEIDGQWSSTAALVKSLDLVVSSCTGVAHLAGALGVPSFVLVPKFAYWAWLHGRTDTPWYAHTRLFRQQCVGDWAGPVRAVRVAIEEMHSRRALVALLDRGHAQAQAPSEYEPEVADVLRRVLRPGDLFVDVGANEGKHTVLAAELVGAEGKVIAFEPGENVLPALLAATERFETVDIVAAACAAESGRDVVFHLCADGSGGNALWDPREFPTNEKTRAAPRSVTLKTTTLDRVLDNRVEPPRLIKIDTEGAEQQVLEGARSLLFAHEPKYIVAELHEFGLAKLGNSQASLRNLMAGYGYSTFVLQPGQAPLFVPAAAVIKSETIVNLLFADPDDVAAIWGEAKAADGKPETRLARKLRETTAAGPVESAIALNTSNGASPGARSQLRG